MTKMPAALWIKEIKNDYVFKMKSELFIEHVIASDSAAISSCMRACIVRDCFVVPPRNDMRRIGHACTPFGGSVSYMPAAKPVSSRIYFGMTLGIYPFVINSLN